jgi:NAD(P)-dependent dehydrogenase (short-subunit alcohol dehydrogenase family)
VQNQRTSPERLDEVASSPKELAGKTILITGAGRGIGAAIADACARAGAKRIALVARTTQELTAVGQHIEARGARAWIGPCDLTDLAELREVVDRLGAVDVLVNCAGANHPEPFIDVSEKTFDRLVALNLKATFFASQIVARGMIADTRPGVIINISSQMGHVGAPDRTVYCATKHAVEGLTKALGVELAAHGIRVVSIAPTFVRTAMTAAQLDDPPIRERLLAQIPLGRFADPEEVASAVVFAASDRAALVTGSSLVLDGGWTAR